MAYIKPTITTYSESELSKLMSAYASCRVYCYMSDLFCDNVTFFSVECPTFITWCAAYTYD